MKKNFFISILIIAVALFVLTKVGFLYDPLSRMTLSLLTPLWETRESITDTLHENAVTPKTRGKLVQENIQLKERIQRLEIQLLGRDLLLEENNQLKELLSYHVREETMILASILTKPNQSPYDTFILDVGTEDTVTQGDIVYAYGDIALGFIDRVSGQSSIVRLFSSPGTKFDVFIGTENISTQVEGQGGGNFIIELPRGVDIVQGDFVMIPGSRSKIIGVVEYIDVKPTDSFQTILFKSPVNIFELKWVEVLLESLQPTINNL